MDVTGGLATQKTRRDQTWTRLAYFLCRLQWYVANITQYNAKLQTYSSLIGDSFWFKVPMLTNNPKIKW